MKIGMITDSLPGTDFDTLLATAARLRLDMLEFGCGNWSSAPHLNLDRMLDSDEERRNCKSRLAEHGIGIGYPDVAELPDEEIDRIVRANFLGVVYGTRECARRLMPNGGSIVATASLAGLTATPMDPVYALTKHAVVGFVRSVALQLAIQGIRINALCPGYTDTGIVPDELRDVLDVPLMEPSFVAEAALQALNDEETGRAWVVQPNRILPFRFPNIPGPR